MTIRYPLTVPAISVTQPLGTFYVVSLPARVLLDTAYSDRLRAVKSSDGTTYELIGSQRELLIPRLKEIGSYISSEESTFPNSIILAANFDQDSGDPIEEDTDEKGRRWRVDQFPAPWLPEKVAFTLTIPSAEALAPIIDGQHRLYGFNYCKKPERLDAELVCSVFIDLPKPFQAFLFATINSNQKPVNKSQTYEQFGYNIESEPPDHWSPDKLAVYFARKLNNKNESGKNESPLTGRILIAAENDFALTRSEAAKNGTWMVSMATVVEGIARLFSQNQKRDRNAYLQYDLKKRCREILRREVPNDKSPLRELFIESNDIIIYTAIRNFLLVADELFWSKASMDSFICKTVGIQALFDVLLFLAREGYNLKDFRINFFKERLAPAGNIDFRSERFKNASGSGRLLIKNCIFRAAGIEAEKFSDLSENRKNEIDDAIIGKPIPT